MIIRASVNEELDDPELDAVDEPDIFEGENQYGFPQTWQRTDDKDGKTPVCPPLST